MIRILIVSVVFSLLAGGVNAAQQPDKAKILERAQKFSSYKVLKEKVKKRDKVRVIVRFKKSISKVSGYSEAGVSTFKASKSRVKNKGLNAYFELEKFNLAAYSLDSQELDELLDSGLIEAIQEDFAVPPALAESIQHIGADIAHQQGFVGNQQAIAILDTGVDRTHPFLENRVIAEACFSTNNGSNIKSLCPSGSNTQYGIGSGVDCNLSLSSCSHGTHVAGIAAGSSSVLSGVAKAADIVSVQVFSEFRNYHSDCDGYYNCVLSTVSDQINALNWVLDNYDNYNIAAVNLSLGGGAFTGYCNLFGFKDIVDSLKAKGVATIVAAGNGSYTNAVSFPGCVEPVITVGSSGNSWDTVSSFSNSAGMVDILAPGEGISSSVPGGGFGSKNGTSMATPHVAGAFAVMKAINPNASVSQIEAALKAINPADKYIC